MQDTRSKARQSHSQRIWYLRNQAHTSRQLHLNPYIPWMIGSSGYRLLKVSGHYRKGMNFRRLQNSNKPYWLLRKERAIMVGSQRAATKGSRRAMENEEKEARAKARKAKEKDIRPELSRESATTVERPDIMPEIVRIHPVEDSELLRDSDTSTLGKVGRQECVTDSLTESYRQHSNVGLIKNRQTIFTDNFEDEFPSIGIDR